MTEPFFVDTNVLLYARGTSYPEKQQAADAWVRQLWLTGRGRISIQVMLEFYANARKVGIPSEELAQQDVRDLLAWDPIVTTVPMVERAWQVQRRHQTSWWDALSVGAALETGCRYLVTEDFITGRDYDGVTAVNPFVTAPAELL